MPSYTQYMRQMAVMDANDDDIESWITVKGNHIPIKKGQSKEDAVKEFISKKSDKEFSKRAEKPQSIGEATKKVVSQVKENREINKEAKKEYAPKNTFLSNPNTLKEFANHFGISESAAKNAAEKYGDEFYNTMVKDPMKGVGMAVGGEKPRSEKAKKENGRYERPVHISEPLKDVVSETKAKTEKKDKAYNDKGLYQDALNELDDQIADKEKELENIHLAMTQNAEAGYFDIANSNMMDIEFVEGQLKELKKKREKLAGSEKTTAEKAGINWEKFEDLEQGSSVSQEITQMANRDDYDTTRALLDRMRHDNDYWLGAGAHANNTLWAKNPKDQIAKMRELLKSLPDKEKPKWLTEKDIDNYEQKMLGKK